MVETDEYDVIVAGAGPAGSSLAGLLAQKGRRVLLLEKEKFPRYHIGESLITGVWPTLEQLGLREELDNSTFIRKYGANVLWGSDEEYWGFEFRDTGRWDYVYQVPRAEFDTMLLGRARALGARVIEEAPVKEFTYTGERMTGVRYQLRGQSDIREATARYIVDATGQQRSIGRERNIVQWHEDLRNVAIWAYYQGCDRYPDQRGGNTVVENLLGGWLWFIPMANGVTSIGFVTAGEVLAASEMSIEDLFHSSLTSSKEVSRLMAPATQVSAYHTARDWSYECSTLHGPGWILVGDAGAFVDPLLSTGVALAVRGARIASQAIDHVLDHPDEEEDTFERYEANCRRYLETILTFVRYFYDQTKNRYQYYKAAQDLVDPEEADEPDFDFVQLVSGLAHDQDLELPVPTQQ